MTMQTVTLANRGGATYRVDSRRPLLGELRNQGVELPYGCEYGGCITNAASLSMARETLKSAPAPPPCPRGAAFRGTAAPSKAKQCRRMRRRSECEKDKKEERVDVWAEHDEAEDALAESMDEVRIEEESISLEQVSRVFGKCKKKGMF